MKKRLVESAFYGAVLTISGVSFYYFFGILYTLASGGDVVKFFWDTVVAGIFCFFFFWYLCWEVTGMFERANKRGRDRMNHKDRKPDQDE